MISLRSYALFLLISFSSIHSSEFFSQNALSAHQTQSADKQRIYKCQHLNCSKSYECRSHLMRHISITHLNKHTQCPTCYGFFTQTSSIKRHIQRGACPRNKVATSLYELPTSQSEQETAPVFIPTSTPFQLYTLRQPFPLQPTVSVSIQVNVMSNGQRALLPYPPPISQNSDQLNPQETLSRDLQAAVFLASLKQKNLFKKNRPSR